MKLQVTGSLRCGRRIGCLDRVRDRHMTGCGRRGIGAKNSRALGGWRQKGIESSKPPKQDKEEHDNDRKVQSQRGLLFGEWVNEVSLGTWWQCGHFGEGCSERNVNFRFGIYGPAVGVEDGAQVPLPQFQPGQ